MPRKVMGKFTDAAGVVWKFWKGRWRKAVARKHRRGKPLPAPPGDEP